MSHWVSEVLYVIALSKRIQWAIILGIVFFVVINLVGSYMVSNLEFTGLFKGLEDVLSEKLLRRYDKIALFALISFWVMAFKFYHRDKQKIW